MASRREVNVNRPEHSWIPFYRELAEKLVEDGWRERQGELVGVLKEMGKSGFRVHPVINDLERRIDPFTVVAMLCRREISWDNLQALFGAYRDEFRIGSRIPVAKPYVPFARHDSLGFFGPNTNLDVAAAKLWEIFGLVLEFGPFKNSEDSTQLIQQIDNCTRIDNIGIPKLTGGFYWIAPEHFLKTDTLAALLGDVEADEITDGARYVDCMRRARESSTRHFAEINVDEFKSRNTRANKKIWLVRAQGGRWTNDFVANGYIGIGFGMDPVDLSDVASRQQIRDLYVNEQPSETSSYKIGQDVGNINRFQLEIADGDYVVTPRRDRRTLNYGQVVSNGTYYVESDDGKPCRNRRNVNWAKGTLSRSDVENRSWPQGTITAVKDESTKRTVFAHILRNGLPLLRAVHYAAEDSWVPFHLEVGRKLVEGEWWREEKREELAQMIDEIRWADPEDVDEAYEYERWAGDPFSFYLSFNMRTTGGMRVPAYRKLKELMQLEAEVPEDGHEAYGLGVGWGWDPPLTDEEISFLWDFFRLATEFEPTINSVDYEDEFIKFYDRAASASFLSGMRSRVLSYLLYWIDPTKYVLTRRLRKEDLGLVADLRALDLTVSQELAGGNEYVRAVGGLLGMGRANGFTILDVNRRSTTREMLGLNPIDEDGAGDPYGIGEMLDDGVFLETGEVERMVRILQSKKNLILQGPPGVGKTFIGRKLAYVLMGSKAEERFTSVQFHQSYSYEDFVGGFRPTVKGDRMVFERQDGPFLDVCKKARSNPDVEYVMLIDEINRGNLSRVFGELLMLIEADKRKPEFAVKLQHRPEDVEGFFVPENVHIIGTMNLADRSLTGMNVAMRRRFGFVDLKPQFNESVFTDWLRDETEMPPEMQARINTKMKALNDAIAGDPSLGYNYAVGHSFFCPPENVPAGGWEEWYKTVVDYEIRPLLREYWFDAPDKANEQADTLL